ncbi:unnamed protein product [Cladocopium goreaui]|uniref:BTB/POZ and MATH domain-containing protein 2 (Protein BTB-POZ AND MATH DOMAIN 2) (AtBPM2) n=1 Tax=Cladocopium goreaui TaxID=2562237 RepID=A0A9P1D1X8_9DINO|nr:unnamed protein product [Cladocopium goreaui]|mmetsp:Transcript_76514/g.169041  ORF Transcript_76514/g.169041 Transcript_76514/m.169041 type:complete len:541 (+) Transcript_76514:69-1691(+)
MATAADLHNQIALAKKTLEEKKQHTQHLREESTRAEERQRLRRQLEEVQKHISHQESINSGERNYRRLLDADALGNTPSDGSKPYEPPPARFNPGSNGELVHCAEVVAKGDYEWRIDGMSWLVNALQQNECPSLESCAFIVGGEEFTLQYNPKCGDVGDLGGQRGSLCLVHQDEGGITFRYRALIKNAAGSYVQWGPEGNECYPAESTCGRAFGPDVYFVEDMDDSNHQVGIFGMTHEQLLKSEWVVDGALTAKFELEVRPNVELDPMPLKRASIEVPPSTIAAEFTAMLEEGRGADVTFLVQGERVPAHSQILAARSSVFERQLNSGMKESISKEIMVEECDLETFKALLKFIYTDDLQRIEELAKMTKADCVGNKLPAPFLQKLLSVSHLYQVSRLRIWCEHKLCECLTVCDAFSILCQGHLYEAKQLEQACLAFIKDNLAQVVSSSSFGRGCKEWPEVVLKINAATAGLDERSAGMAFEALREKKPEVPEISDSGAEAVPAAESGTKTVKSEKPPSEKPSEKPPASTEKPAKRKRTS